MAKETPMCEVVCFDEEKVVKVKSELDYQDTGAAAAMFKALADDTRMKIAFALCTEDELCVCDIANIIGASVAAASHHLRLLNRMGLAKYRKEGKLVFYSLDDDHVRQFVTLALAHSKELAHHG